MMHHSVLIMTVLILSISLPMVFAAVPNSPKAQLSSGADLHEIQCKEGYELILKAKKWNPACVKQSSVERLISLGWAADHDVQNDKLMEAEKMAEEKKEEEKKSYKVELEESMEMAGP